ncbi:Uncharacterised protein [Lysinibacillus capsici]|uniref:Uncharacterized protein n=1 Tax=Lysinibacillus capsici TaxID=2115968 RepID=A0A2X0XH39_9BACI|nr:DUF1827 family protein [Lysinibacillus capsici]SPT98455.1 Uncharacterised protein [Lysinibacillus capsici]
MAIKSKFFDRTFRNTTKEREDIIKIVSRGETEGTVVTIYERKNTLVIHSKSDSVNHASISKAKGHIKEWEIDYIIDNIIKEDKENVVMYSKGTKVIHIRAKEENFVFF